MSNYLMPISQYHLDLRLEFEKFKYVAEKIQQDKEKLINEFYNHKRPTP